MSLQVSRERQKVSAMRLFKAPAERKSAAYDVSFVTHDAFRVTRDAKSVGGDAFRESCQSESATRDAAFVTHDD